MATWLYCNSYRRFQEPKFCTLRPQSVSKCSRRLHGQFYWYLPTFGRGRGGVSLWKPCKLIVWQWYTTLTCKIKRNDRKAHIPERHTRKNSSETILRGKDPYRKVSPSSNSFQNLVKLITMYSYAHLSYQSLDLQSFCLICRLAKWLITIQK